MQVVVSPSQETIISLAGIKPQQSIGVLCQSTQFRAIIQRKLESLLITNRVADLEFPREAERLEAFVADQDMLIVPPDFTATARQRHGAGDCRIHGGRRADHPVRLPDRTRIAGVPGRADSRVAGAMKTPTIVLGVIGSDCHSVGNKILDAFFSDRGFRVVNLGVMVSQDEFIDAAIETAAAAILVSSLYGHGEIDCARVSRAVRRARPGGHPAVHRRQPGGRQDAARGDRGASSALGFDRVFMPGDDLEQAAACLRADIAAARASAEADRMTRVASFDIGSTWTKGALFDLDAAAAARCRAAASCPRPPRNLAAGVRTAAAQLARPAGDVAVWTRSAPTSPVTSPRRPRAGWRSPRWASCPT